MLKSIRTMTINVAGRGAAAAIHRRSPTLDGVRLVDYWTLGGVGPRTVEFLAAQITARRPQRILECGPGTSTIAMARCVAALGLPTTITSLEHDGSWAEIMRRRLDASGLLDRVRIVVSPLARVEGEEFGWYADGAEAGRDGPFDLMFIDGPPATDGRARRSPALPCMWEHLADGALVVLDDGRRPGERECVRLWRERFGARLGGDLAPVEKGLWTLEKRPAPPTDAEVIVAPWVKRHASAR